MSRQKFAQDRPQLRQRSPSMTESMFHTRTQLAKCLMILRDEKMRIVAKAAFAARLPCPLLVLHGTLDEICPHDDGQQIAAAAAPRSLFISISGAGHNDLWTDEPYRTQCARAVADFLVAIRDPTRAAHFLGATARPAAPGGQAVRVEQSPTTTA